MNYPTDEFGNPINPVNPLPVDDVSVARDYIPVSETITFITGAAGTGGSVRLDKGPVAGFYGDRVGSFWSDLSNLIIQNGARPGNDESKVTAVTETAGSADVTIYDPSYNLSELLPPTANDGEYVIVLTDESGNTLYGWVDAVAANGSDSYTLDIYSEPAIANQDWVGSLANFTFAAGSTRYAIFRNNSSFAWTTGTILTREVAYKSQISDLAQISDFENGNYAVDYYRGRILYKKATTGTSDVATYGIQGNTVVALSSSGGSSENTHDTPVVATGTQTLYEAKTFDGSALPNSVAEGDAVRPAATEYGVTYVTVVNDDGSEQPAYDSGQDAFRQGEINPLSDHYAATSLVDTTNVSATTHYYPSSTGGVMDGYSDLSVSGKFIDADGTMTMTVEMMNDEDSSSGDWIQVYGYDDKNNTTTNSWSVTNGTLTFAISFKDANYKRYRVALVASGATNTAIIKQRKKY